MTHGPARDGDSRSAAGRSVGTTCGTQLDGPNPSSLAATHSELGRVLGQNFVGSGCRNLDAAVREDRILLPNFIPTIGSQRVPLRPSSSRARNRVIPMSSEIGTERDEARPDEICPISLIMLRSLVRFQLAPPTESPDPSLFPFPVQEGTQTGDVVVPTAVPTIFRNRSGGTVPDSIRKRADRGPDAWEPSVFLGRDRRGNVRHKSRLFGARNAQQRRNLLVSISLRTSSPKLQRNLRRRYGTDPR
jgi:hypothetical protein